MAPLTGQLQGERIVDEVMTGIAVGYVNDEFVAEALFPVAESKKESVLVPKFGKEAFILRKTERAIRAASNIIQPSTRSSDRFTLVEHDEGYPVDYREVEEDVFSAEANATLVATEAVQLGREAACAAIATDVNNYAVSNRIILSGNKQFTAPQSDPVGVVDDGKEAIRTQIGREPNTMVIGASSFKALKNHPAMIERMKYARKGVITLDDLKEIFDMANIKIGKGVYCDAKERMYDIWPDSIVLAYVPMAQKDVKRSFFTPSYGYTIQKAGQPTVDKYITDGGKISIFRSTNIYVPALLGMPAGYLISDTNASPGQNP